MAPISTAVANMTPAETMHEAAGQNGTGPSIPLISLAPLVDPNTPPASRREAAQSLLSAFQTFGFFYLTSYSSLIPQDLIERVFKQSTHFFALPLDVKESVRWTTPSANRGYQGMGRETLSERLTQEEVEKQRVAEGGDKKETFEVGREGQEEYPNRWYQDDPANGVGGADNFRETMQEFWIRCKKVNQAVMRGVALGLEIGEDYFDPFTKVGDNNLRLLHYPPVPSGWFESGKRVRAGAHSDYGSVTLLFQDSRGGLQVEPPPNARGISQGWIDVEPIEGTIVVNAGDLMARWSNDLIRSTKHRVVEPPLPSGGKQGQKVDHPARYSIAYFCSPDYDRLIEALPGTWEAETGGKKYEPINSGAYLEYRLSATH